MKFVGKTLGDYFTVLQKYLAIIIILGLVRVIRLFVNYPPEIQFLGTILILVVTFLAGWETVREHGFNYKQTGFVGFLLSFGSHWTLPIFHNMWEMLYYFLVNSFVFIIMTIFGSWLTRMFKNYNLRARVVNFIPSVL